MLLFRLGYLDEATCYFRKALQIDPGYLAARENLENTCSHLVERWHFRMLNDKKRNLAYKNALCALLTARKGTVLDIGSGTGLLRLVLNSLQPFTFMCGLMSLVEILIQKLYSKLKKSIIGKGITLCKITIVVSSE